MDKSELIIAGITAIFMLLSLAIYYTTGGDAMQGITNIILALIFQQVALDRMEK